MVLGMYIFAYLICCVIVHKQLNHVISDMWKSWNGAIIFYCYLEASKGFAIPDWLVDLVPWGRSSLFEPPFNISVSNQCFTFTLHRSCSLTWKNKFLQVLSLCPNYCYKSVFTCRPSDHCFIVRARPSYVTTFWLWAPLVFSHDWIISMSWINVFVIFSLVRTLITNYEYYFQILSNSSIAWICAIYENGLNELNPVIIPFCWHLLKFILC